MAVKQKSSAVLQAEQVVAQANKVSHPIHHIIRSITANPELVLQSHPNAITGDDIDQILAVWYKNGYELFKSHLPHGNMGGVKRDIQVFHMIYILKKK